jgi:hypothetical protein
MGQFGIETRKWLESAIKQRKLLLKLNKSHKPQMEVEVAIEILDGILSTYSYENDIHMARFIRQNIGRIENILPGSGATGYKKKMEQLAEINKRAILIIDQNPPMNPPRGGIKSAHLIETSTKTNQYEMEF